MKTLGTYITRWFLCMFVFGTAVYAQTTGEVELTDSNYAAIGNSYPAGTTVVYVEVRDADKNISAGNLDTLHVTFYSPVDTLGEVVVLNESGINTGIFRGSIDLELVSLALNGRPIRDVLAEARQGPVDEKYRGERIHRVLEKIRQEIAEQKRLGSLRSFAVLGSDSLLQIRSGDSLIVKYLDELDDFGNMQVITDAAIMGGVSGYVSGVWTQANNPYVVTGDVVIDYTDSLIIEAGVEVRFQPGYSMFVNGQLKVMGAEGDSVRFTLNAANPNSIDWGGIYFSNSDTTLHSELNYAVVEYGNGITMNHGHIIRHSILRKNHTGLQGYQAYGLIQDCIVENSMYLGIELHYDSPQIDRTEIRNNGTVGLYLHYTSATITYSSIINNGYRGVHSAGNSNISVNYSNLYGNANYDWYNDSANEMNAQYNFWGDSTTAEMNAGNNPKNISVIYDVFDNASKGFINYSKWVQEPVFTPPLPPILIAPQNNAINQPTIITFLWHSPRGAEKCHLQVSTDSLFNTTVFDNATITDTMQQVGPLTLNTKYFWRVRASNVIGIGEWSQVRRFVVNPPIVPVLIYPPNHSVGVLTNPTLVWNHSSGATSYQVQASTDSNFSSTLLDSSGLTQTSFPIAGLTANVTYYWRIKSFNNGGSSGWSTIWDFTVSVPVVPVLIFPSNGAQDVEPKPTYKWNLSMGASSYHFQLATGSSFTLILMDLPGIADTSLVSDSLDLNNTYYWRVNATNDVGTSDWSSVWQFKTKFCTPGFLGNITTSDTLANSTDALIILSYNSGLPVPPDIQNLINIGFGDINEDSITNSTDALIIISYDVGVPVPFPVGDPICLPNGNSRSYRFNMEHSQKSKKH